MPIFQKIIEDDVVVLGCLLLLICLVLFEHDLFMFEASAQMQRCEMHT